MAPDEAAMAEAEAIDETSGGPAVERVALAGWFLVERSFRRIKRRLGRDRDHRDPAPTPAVVSPPRRPRAELFTPAYLSAKPPPGDAVDPLVAALFEPPED